jgi:hypothetical protein
VAVVLGCGALAACGSSGGSKSSGTSPASGSKTSTSSATKPPSGGSGSEFCTAAKAQVEELPQKLQTLLASGDSSAWLQYANDEEQNNQALGRLAPSEIKADWATLEQAPVAVIKAIRDANGNISQIRIGLTQVTRISTSPEFRAASARWTQYLTQKCGITLPGVPTT